MSTNQNSLDSQQARIFWREMISEPALGDKESSLTVMDSFLHQRGISKKSIAEILAVLSEGEEIRPFVEKIFETARQANLTAPKKL